MLRANVLHATGGLTCSVGIAPNRVLAKVCADLRKPDGQYRLESSPDAVRSFLRALPVRKVPGVGRVMESTLAALGVRTCGDVVEQRGMVQALFSAAQSDFLLRAAAGVVRARHPGGLGWGVDGVF